MDALERLRRAGPPAEVPLRLVPEELVNFSVPCDACGHANRPPWFTVFPEPFAPIKPRAEPPKSTARWLPQSKVLACERCLGEVTLGFPRETIRVRCFLYGDEAYRDLGRNGGHAIAYSFVGTTEPLLEQLERAVRELKRRLLPIDPNAWRLHMSAINSPQARLRHAHLSSWTHVHVRTAIEGMFDLVANTSGLLVYSISAVTKPQVKFRVEGRHEAYVALLMYVIDQLTRQGAQPIMRLDADKPVPRESEVVQEWARRLFFNSQYCLLYPFLAKGIEIPEPVFVKPGSHPCLELADFVSYLVARHYHDRHENKTPHLHPERLGPNTVHIGFDALMNLQVHSGTELPTPRATR